MRKLIVVISSILCSCICISAFASQKSDTLKQSTNYPITPFVSIDLQSIVTESGSVLDQGFSAGVTIKEKLNLGIYASWNSDYLTFEKLGLPSLRMKYRQGGVLTSYDHNISKILALNIGAKVGQGRVRLLNVGEENLITTHRAVIMHPDVGIELSPIARTKIKFNVGYRLMTDQKMQRVIQGDLTGFSYGINLKFDLF